MTKTYDTPYQITDSIINLFLFEIVLLLWASF